MSIPPKTPEEREARNKSSREYRRRNRDTPLEKGRAKRKAKAEREGREYKSYPRAVSEEERLQRAAAATRRWRDNNREKIYADNAARQRQVEEVIARVHTDK